MTEAQEKILKESGILEEAERILSSVRNRFPANGRDVRAYAVLLQSFRTVMDISQLKSGELPTLRKEAEDICAALAARMDILGAMSGDARAVGVLGETYLHGNKGAETDLEKAFLWSEKAAQSGEIRALTNLGILYRTGSPWLSQDVERAKRAFEQIPITQFLGLISGIFAPALGILTAAGMIIVILLEIQTQ